MKISIIGPTHPFRGGISHYTTLLCKVLRRQHDVQFVSYSRQYPQFLFPGTSDKDPSQKPLSIQNVEYCIDSLNPLTWLKAAEKINRFKPDILLVPWWITFWVPQYLIIIKLVKKKTRCRILFLCHNVVEHEENFLKILGSKLVLSQADCLITHSREETAKIHNLLGPDMPVTTACHPPYTGLQTSFPDKETARRQLGVNTPYVLLFFGFVRPYKGLDLLLEAMPLILQHRDVALLVVGEFWEPIGNYRQKILDLGINDQVTMVNKYIPNEEVGLYFSAADLAVLPYRAATGSGISQLAYSLGCPVVASDCGSLSEVIDDGKNGRLVPPGDVNGFARAVIDSLDPDTLNRFHEGAAQAKQRFSWEDLADAINNCSEKLQGI